MAGIQYSFGSLPSQYTDNGHALFGDHTTNATGYGRVQGDGLELGLGFKPRQQNVVDQPDSITAIGKTLELDYTLPAGTETTPTVNPSRGNNSLELEVSGAQLYDTVVGHTRSRDDAAPTGFSGPSTGRDAHEVDFIFSDSSGDLVQGYLGVDPIAGDPYHLGFFDKSTHQLLIGDDGDDGSASHKPTTTQNSEQANFFEQLGVAGLTAGSSYDFTLEELDKHGRVSAAVHAHVNLV